MGRPFKSMDWPTEVVGRPLWSPCLMSLAVNIVGRAEPGGRNRECHGPGRAEKIEKIISQENLKFDGPCPGCSPSSEN